MEPVKSFTPNARIIYKESLDAGRDWSSICGELDQFIERLPNASLANPFVSIIFFVPSNDEFFDSEDVWVCREIIGHVPAVDEEFGVYDLDQAEVVESEVINNPLSFTQILKEEQRLRSESSEFADSWRVLWHEGLGPNKVKLQLFFKE